MVLPEAGWKLLPSLHFDLSVAYHAPIPSALRACLTDFAHNRATCEPDLAICRITSTLVASGWHLPGCLSDASRTVAVSPTNGENRVAI